MAKKLLVLLLTFTLVFSLAIPAFAADNPVADTGDATITVKFTDVLNWGSPKVYYWNNGPAWPGTDMTIDEVNDYGENVYRATIPANVAGIIFNGGGKQTVNIETGIVDGAQWYTKDEKEGSNYKVGYVAPAVQPTVAPTQTPTSAPTPSNQINIRFSDVLNWGTVGVYYWFEGSTFENPIDNGWPGDEMTPAEINGYGQQVFTATIPRGVEGIIFTDYYGDEQTVDITDGIVDGAWWYTEDSLLNGKYEVGYIAPSVQPTVAPTQAPTQPATNAPSGKATVKLYSIKGVLVEEREYNVGDTFTVYTNLNVSYNSGKIASFSATQTYTNSLLQLNGVTDGEFDDLSDVFPVTGDSTVSNPGAPGIIRFNATNGSMDNPYLFNSNDDILIKTSYTVTAAGTAEIQTGIKTLASADTHLTKLVNKSVVLVENSFTTSISFNDPDQGPVITTQPANWSGPVGANVSFNVVAEGNDLTYQWYYRAEGKTKWYALSGAVSETYSTVMNTNRAGRSIKCEITDASGKSVETDVVTMTIGETGGPVITTQPQNWSGPVGAQVSFNVVAEGDGLTYQWYYRAEGKTKWYALDGATSAVYSTIMNTNRAGRSIKCEITDANGKSVETDVVTMTIGDGPYIITQPKNWSGPVGANVSFNVVAEGNGLTYQWYYRAEGKTKWYALDGAVSSTYSTIMNSNRAGRSIKCEITDANGKSVETNVVTMTIGEAGGPVIITQPQNWTGPAGATVTFSVAAQGDGLTYQWYYRAEGKTKWYALDGAVSSTYSTIMNTNRAGRSIKCQISDAAGNTVETNVVTMNIAG